MQLKPRSLFWLVLGLCLGSLGTRFIDKHASPSAIDQQASSTRQKDQEKERPPAYTRELFAQSEEATQSDSSAIASNLDKTADNNEQDAAALMASLLERGQFDAATHLYAEYEQKRSRLSTSLRAQILNEMRDSLNNDDRFIDLSDAYLSYYYADIDALILAAEYNANKNYFSQTWQTLEFAFQNSNDDKEKRLVRDNFKDFVSQVEQHFNSAQRTDELIAFYYEISESSLFSNQYLFRFAELNFLAGNESLAKQLFQPLRNDPQFRDSVAAILDNLKPSSPAPISPSRQWESEIALTQYGNHYIAVINVEGSEDIPLLVDTGASITTISSQRFYDLSRDYSFTYLGARLFNTAGGLSKGFVYRSKNIQFGPYVLNDVEFAVLDIALYRGYEGLLGMNILRNFQFQIDQDSAILKLNRRSR